MNVRFLRSVYLRAIGYTGALRAFREACALWFGYLTKDFGFRAPEYEEVSYGGVVSFENSTTTVKVHLDWREELVLVYVRPATSHPDETRRRHVRDSVVVHISKEAHLWEQQYFLGAEPDAQIVYGPADADIDSRRESVVTAIASFSRAT